MYGALASDVADASAGSGVRRAVRLISAYIIANCLSHISVYAYQMAVSPRTSGHALKSINLLADRPLRPIACQSKTQDRNFYI